MRLMEEFINRYACEGPEGLPESLLNRLTFVSCLSQKEDRRIYLVIDGLSGNKAILKITDPKSPDSVKREYELLTKLIHPSIPVPIYYETDKEGREYLLRTYAEGETLDHLLERDGMFSGRQVLEMALKICEILSYLHGQKPPIIYRDLKPQNIAITPNGKLSLFDFGIAREDKKDKEYDTVYVGSVAFASPEQFGFTKTDARSDIYTLGKLMMFLLTGDTEQSEYANKIKDKGIRKTIAKCTRLSPEKRYHSVEQLAKAIRWILYPPTKKEMIVGAAVMVLVIAIGSLVWTRMDLAEKEELPPSLVSAVGTEASQEMKLKIRFETRMKGKPFLDCAVSADNHHWYEPAPGGIAELEVLAHDRSMVRAASGNQSFIKDMVISKAGGPYILTLDFADLPSAPELIEHTLNNALTHEIPLNVMGANAVNLSGQPEGISVRQHDSGYFLYVEAGAGMSGHYTIFMESINEHGKADTWLHIYLEDSKPVTLIRTAGELDAIRSNLAGHYELAADIDLRGWGEWISIGTREYPFTGKFDGKGHTISAMFLRGDTGNTSFDLGLFGVINRGEVSNLIIKSPQADVHNESFGDIGAVVGTLFDGLVENCAVLDGELRADIGMDSSLGGIAGYNQGIIRRCFNSSTLLIYNGMQRTLTDSNAGGIVGTNQGFAAECCNVGKVTGVVLAGGIAGISDKGSITRCINTGQIKAPYYLGVYPPGGIAHLLGRGVAITYSAFERGSAPVGTTVFNRGTLLGIKPLSKEEFNQPDMLAAVFHDWNAKDKWIYSDILPGYPLPRGIWEE